MVVLVVLGPLFRRLRAAWRWWLWVAWRWWLRVVWRRGLAVVRRWGVLTIVWRLCVRVVVRFMLRIIIVWLVCCHSWIMGIVVILIPVVLTLVLAFGVPSLTIIRIFFIHWHVMVGVMIWHVMIGVVIWHVLVVAVIMVPPAFVIVHFVLWLTIIIPIVRCMLVVSKLVMIIVVRVVVAVVSTVMFHCPLTYINVAYSDRISGVTIAKQNCAKMHNRCQTVLTQH